MSILEDFYYSHIEPQPRSAAYRAEIREVSGLYERHREKLLSTFNDEQKEWFEKFEDCWSEYTSYAEEAIFEYAFRLGARLAIEVQTDTEE